MPPDLTIRPATVEDAALIAGLVRALCREEGFPESTLDEAQVRADGFGAAPRFRVLVAERNGAPVGYALTFPSCDTDSATHGRYVQDLYVVPEARRQGVGRALMAAVARACRAGGGGYLFWNVRLANPAGLAFYRALGARAEPTVTMSLEAAPLARLADAAA